MTCKILLIPATQSPPSHTPSHQGRALRRIGVATSLVSLLTLAACGSSDEFVPTPRLAGCLQPVGTSSVVVGSGLPGDPAIPEPSSGYKLGKKVLTSASYMVSTPNPLATQAGCDVLAAGGSAMDAAVAVQAVLGLVEPQSSGLGGGTFMLHYSSSTKVVESYDGRETAPAAATEDYLRFVSSTDRTPPLPNLGNLFASTRASGRSIGTPGTVRMLELAHKDHGARPWSTLMQPGIKLATDGFPIGGRMAAAIAGARNDFLRDADATAYFLNPDFTPKALGTVIRNPAYAATLSSIAAGGANAFYTGPIAQSIVDKIKVTSAGATTTVAITPGLMELSDLANYKAVKRTPVCGNYRATVVCGMGPPSSGGIAVAQTLGILDNFNLAALPPTGINIEGGKPAVQAVHLVSEAQRLAFADRNKYVADTDFVALPGLGVSSMLDRAYLKSRADLISTSRSMGTATAGVFATAQAQGASAAEGNGTTHMSIVDAAGNVVVMTSTIEGSMGSFRLTRGFLLNHQLTDFEFVPVDAAGAPIANRIQPLKRPRSSMAPTIVFNRAPDGSRGDFLMATGSVGGAPIIQFVVKAVVSAVDWGFDAQQSSSMVNFGAANSVTTSVGGEHPAIDATTPAGGLAGGNDSLITGLRALGHTVSLAAQASGVSTVIKVPAAFGRASVLQGGADPRREGLALGDALP